MATTIPLGMVVAIGPPLRWVVATHRVVATTRWVATHRASFLTKIGKMQSAGCRLCKMAQEARGESTDGLADETHGHINSAGCKGMATTVTVAHHSIWRHMYHSMHAAQKPKIKLKFVTLNMSTLWQREELLRICSKEELAEKAQALPAKLLDHFL